MQTKFFWGIDGFGDIDVDGRLALRRVLNILHDGMDWIQRVEDRGH
jgi:hypothetical protein